MEPLRIRRADAHDRAAIVAIGRELVADGTTYVFAPETTDAELAAYWLSAAVKTFVAERGDDIVGCSIPFSLSRTRVGAQRRTGVGGGGV